MKKRKLKRRIKIIFIIIILIVIGFFVNKRVNFINKLYDKIFSVKDTSTNPKKDVLKEEDVIKEKSINLETSSGAVLVGTIKKDDEGWYFLLEKPLNLTLNYFIDHPEKFEDVIKLRMLDDEDDNINKSIYSGEIVTIYGEITNPRSQGILYFYPYNIQIGKVVKDSYADENIEKPNNEFGETNKNLLPSKMNLIIEDGEYKYNFYSLSEETINRFDNDFISFYLDFIDAFLNFKTSIKCPKKYYASYLFMILDYEFPVFYADGTYDYINSYDSDTKTINWSYTVKSKKEHDKLISDFEKDANDLLKGVKENFSDNEKAKTIYHNLVSVISYDYNALETFKNAESYYAITNHTGVCHSFAYAYNKLLTNAKVESTVATGLPKGSSLGHVWSVVKIDDKYYFADPTYEINTKGYEYYGMGLKERSSTSEYFEDNIKVGYYTSVNMKDFNDFSSSIK